MRCCLVAQSCPAVCDHMDVASQAFLSMGLSRQEYRSGGPFSPPEHLPDPEVKLTSPMFPVLQVDSLLAEPLGKLKTLIWCQTNPSFLLAIQAQLLESLSLIFPFLTNRDSARSVLLLLLLLPFFF